MQRMRWVADGGGAWELDAEAPVTMEGTARAVPGDPLPLGLSRGGRASRAKQLDFFHRFMASPLVPSFSADPHNSSRGLLLHHAHLLHLRENWSVTLLEQVNVQNFFSLIQERASSPEKYSWPKTIVKHMFDFLSLGFGTEFLITPDTSLLIETYDVRKENRAKAIFRHQLRQHNLMLEASSPGLFVDKNGIYWDVPLSMGIDLSSIASHSGLSYHLCVQHNSRQPKHFGGDHTSEVPASLLPGLCARAAISIKKSLDIWRKKEGKLKMVQPYDVFLSDPHISGSGIIGAVTSVSLGECSARLSKDELQKGKAFRLHARRNNIGLFGDLFASFSCTAQRGHFQRLILDLTRLSARLDIPSASVFLSGAVRLAQDFYNSRRPDSEAIRAICPDLTVSLQQQIVGPFSFRVDSRIVFDQGDARQFARIGESVFGIDWALKVLGSAKATAWYSPRRCEAMLELRFFES